MINLLLVTDCVVFEPNLDPNLNTTNVPEVIHQWVTDMIHTVSLLPSHCEQENYQKFLESDADIQKVTADIGDRVEDVLNQCQEFSSRFHNFNYLWKPGKDSEEQLERISLYSSTGGELNMETVCNNEGMVQPKSYIDSSCNNSLNSKYLEELSAKEEEYQKIQETVNDIPDFMDIGWIRINMESLKLTINNIQSRKMVMIMECLSQKVSCLLADIDVIIKKFQDEIEELYGSERDVISFRRFIKLSNQFYNAEAKIDENLGFVDKSIEILRNYEQKLPIESVCLHEKIPERWNDMKQKISETKEKVKPLILQDSLNIKEKLEGFSNSITKLHSDVEQFYKTGKVQGIDIEQGYVAIEEFSSSLGVIEEEAQDFREVEDILQTSILNFDNITECRKILTDLKTSWRVYR
ncbi:hypothetical protein Ahia01_001232000 [Argonauta hians]